MPPFGYCVVRAAMSLLFGNEAVAALEEYLILLFGAEAVAALEEDLMTRVTVHFGTRCVVLCEMHH
jgi:hypothetical protein